MVLCTSHGTHFACRFFAALKSHLDNVHVVRLASYYRFKATKPRIESLSYHQVTAHKTLMRVPSMPAASLVKPAVFMHFSTSSRGFIAVDFCTQWAKILNFSTYFHLFYLRILKKIASRTAFLLALFANLSFSICLIKHAPPPPLLLLEIGWRKAGKKGVLNWVDCWPHSSHGFEPPPHESSKWYLKEPSIKKWWSALSVLSTPKFQQKGSTQCVCRGEIFPFFIIYRQRQNTWESFERRTLTSLHISPAKGSWFHF